MDIREIISLSLIKGIGPAFLKKNMALLIASEKAEIFLESTGKEIDDPDTIYSARCSANAIVTECTEKGYSIIDITSSSYPALLKELSDPPVILYALGNISLMNNAISIIGTRESTELGEKIASRVGEFFSHDFAICNGLVEGIDSAAISINGEYFSNVVGVISGGLNYHDTCTKSHAAIIDKVLAAGGLILSEYPPSQKEDQFSGSKVSRIQAGLSKGLILIQSSLDGGSKYTIKAFSKLGRTLGVVHYPEAKEYNEESFSANRHIVSKGIEGVRNFIGQKTSAGIDFNSIIRIERKEDYSSFVRAIKEQLMSSSIFG